MSISWGIRKIITTPRFKLLEDKQSWEGSTVMSPNVFYRPFHWTRGMNWTKSLGKVMKNYEGGDVGQIIV